MARILFDLQISSYNAEDEVLLSSDSNFIFTRNLLRGLIDKGHTVFLIVGHNWHPKAGLNDVNLIRTTYRGPVADRYFMDYELIEKIQNLNIDFLWTNDPCRVGAYRVGYKGPMLAYNHWIDNPIDSKTPPSLSYHFRQLEAAHKADYLGFNSEFGLDLFKRGIPAQGDLLHVDLEKKAFILPPSLDTALLNNVRNMRLRKKRPTIIYNHRLSSAPQYDTATQRLARTLDKIDTRYGVENYQVFFTNPSGKKHPILNRRNAVEVHRSDYEFYLREISSGYVHLTMFSYPGQWSMAMAEAMCLGLPCIYPDHSGYAEMVGDNYGPTQGLFKLDDQADSTIIHFLDHPTFFDRGNYLRDYSKEAAVDKVEALVNAAIQSR